MTSTPADPFENNDVNLNLLREQIATTNLTTSQARQKLAALWAFLENKPAGLSAIQRGYRAERVIIALAVAEKLETESPNRPKGEQVDGLIVVDHWHLLVETKWHQNELPASSIYAFQGKLRGKIVGTLGLFVSVNGFSEDAPRAVAHGKPVDVILADGADIKLCLQPNNSLTEMLRVKLRRAARNGIVYMTYQSWLDTRSA